MFPKNVAQFRYKAIAKMSEASNLFLGFNLHSCIYICSNNKKQKHKTQRSLLMAPHKSNPSRRFFHARAHTCLPQAFPGHTRALENSHACFPKPASSSSPTSSSYASLDPPGFSPLYEPKRWADGQLGV